MLTFTLEATGHTESDVQEAVEEALRRFLNGNRSGFDRNESGRFTFDVAGDAEPEPDEPPLDSDPPLAVGDTLSGLTVVAVSTCQRCETRIGWTWDMEIDDDDQDVPSTEYGWWRNATLGSEVCPQSDPDRPGQRGVHRPEGATEDNEAPAL